MKRFTETNKWQDAWFMDLPKDGKLIWLYICDTCDHAGIYEVNIPLMKFVTGTSANLGAILDMLDGRIVEVSSDKWFLPKFVEFQYGKELNPQSRVHQSVIKRLDSLSIPYPYPIHRVKDKDKDIQSNKKGESEGDFYSGFDEFWELYPRKTAKKDARQAWKSGKCNRITETILDGLKKHIPTWSQKEKQYIPHPATFINGQRWEDEPIKGTNATTRRNRDTGTLNDGTIDRANDELF